MSKLFDDASLAMIPSAYKDGKLYSIRPTDGSGDFTFSRGSNLAATRVDVNGLIEKGRENLLTYSNDFTSGNWTTANISLTSGQSGYDGSNDAWLAQGNGLGTSRLQQNGLNWTNSVYSLSFYAKAGTESVINIYDGTWSGAIGATYDLSTGTATQYAISIPVVEAKMVSAGNGWWRCSFTAIPNAFTNTAGFVRIGIGSTTAANSGNIYIQDAQLEQGLVATDYIETTTTSVSAGILEDMPRLDYSGGASCPSLLLEPSRTNVLSYSEYFNGWLKPDDGVTLNINTSDTLDPSGYYGATKVTSIGGNRRIYDVTGITAGTYTCSVFVKAGTGSVFNLFTSNSAFLIEFDLSTESVTETIGSGTITSYPNGWYRCTATGTAPSGDVIQFIFPNNNNETIYIWGAQFEQGSYPTSYIPTYGTSQTRSEDNMETGTLDTLTSYSMLVDIKSLKDIGGSATFIDKGVASSNFGRIFLKNGSDISYFSSSTGYLDNDLSLSDGAQHKYLLRVTNGFIEEFFDGVKQTNTDTNSNDLFKGLEIPTSDAQLNLKQLLVFPTALTDSECIALTSI